MRRMLWLLLIVISALLPAASADAQVATPRAATPTPATRGPATISTCQDLLTAERRLDREIPNLNPAGPRGNPQLCLLFYPAEDMYGAALLRVDSLDQFRGAKDDALRRLAAAGFHACAIGTWVAYGRPAPRLSAEDQEKQSAECAPRVVPVDDRARSLLGDLQSLVAGAVATTAEQMGWRPDRSVTMLVMATPEAALTTYQRYVQSADLARQFAEGGLPLTLSHAIFGRLMLLNLSRARDPLRTARAQLAHEYTHVAQAGIGGATRLFPKWFVEGQADYQEHRNAASQDFLLRGAEQAQQAGVALRLPELARRDDWSRHETQAGAEAVYSRAFAAARFLVERYGFDLTVQLLRENRNGDLTRFEEVLARTTGMSTDALDAAVGEWLLQRTAPLEQPPDQGAPAGVQESEGPPSQDAAPDGEGSGSTGDEVEHGS